MSTAVSTEPCVRCERKGSKCRPAPESKDCKNCTTAGAKCFRANPLDPKMLALTDDNTPKSYENLGKFHLALFEVVKYNKLLRDDAKDSNSLVGDVSMASNPRETINYVVDISWSYDLVVMTNHFGEAVEAFLKSSAEAKEDFIAEYIAKHTPKEVTITERIKTLKFTFDEDDEGDYDAEWPALPTPAAPAPTEEELAEFKIDSDTTELLMEAYNGFLKLFNLAADPLERAVTKCGITAPIRYRAEEHMGLDNDDEEEEEEEETAEPVIQPEPVAYKNAKARRKAEKKAKEEAAAKAEMKKQKERVKRIQVLPAGTFAETLLEQKAHISEAFENALKECVKLPADVEAARKTGDKAQVRYRRLFEKMEKSG